MHGFPPVPDGQSNTEGCYHINKNYIASPRRFGKLQLVQLGRLHCKRDTAIAEHAHIHWFELTVANAGKGIVYTNGVPVPIAKGDIYLSFPWDHHAIRTDENDLLKYDFFAFATEDEALYADLLGITETHASADQRTVRDEAVAALISNATTELDGSLRHAEQMLDSLLCEIVIRVVRAFLCKSENEAPRTAAESADALCYRLMHYIDTHIYSMDGLSVLSEYTGYNYSYLSALYKTTTGESLSSYYRTRRLETARLHITENLLSITQIAEILRYSSIYTFSRAFKDAYGVCPEQYRRTLHPERTGHLTI